jgi:hypothetical protein
MCECNPELVRIGYHRTDCVTHPTDEQRAQAVADAFTDYQYQREAFVQAARADLTAPRLWRRLRRPR